MARESLRRGRARLAQGASGWKRQERVFFPASYRSERDCLAGISARCEFYPCPCRRKSPDMACGRGIVDQLGETVQNTFGAGILNPALLPNPRHALFIAQLSNLVLRRVEVRKLSRASAHSRSQISTGKGLSSSRVRAGAASTG